MAFQSRWIKGKTIKSVHMEELIQLKDVLADLGADPEQVDEHIAECREAGVVDAD